MLYPKTFLLIKGFIIFFVNYLGNSDCTEYVHCMLFPKVKALIFRSSSPLMILQDNNITNSANVMITDVILIFSEIMQAKYHSLKKQFKINTHK